MYLYKDLTPTKTDTTAIEAAIATLTANEALDDKALAALETLVKTIDLTPYAKSKDVTDNIAAIPPQVIHVDRDLVEADFDTDWKLCNQIITDTVASTITVRLWVRVDATSAIPIGVPRVEPLPAKP